MHQSSCLQPAPPPLHPSATLPPVATPQVARVDDSEDAMYALSEGVLLLNLGVNGG